MSVNFVAYLDWYGIYATQINTTYIFVGVYVRQRRLTLAGSELVSTDAKIIDIALKYGYDSPDSFA